MFGVFLCTSRGKAAKAREKCGSSHVPLSVLCGHLGGAGSCLRHKLDFLHSSARHGYQSVSSSSNSFRATSPHLQTLGCIIDLSTMNAAIQGTIIPLLQLLQWRLTQLAAPSNLASGLKSNSDSAAKPKVLHSAIDGKRTSRDHHLISEFAD